MNGMPPTALEASVANLQLYPPLRPKNVWVTEYQQTPHLWKFKFWTDKGKTLLCMQLKKRGDSSTSRSWRSWAEPPFAPLCMSRRVFLVKVRYFYVMFYFATRLVFMLESSAKIGNLALVERALGMIEMACNFYLGDPSTCRTNEA